MKRPLILLSLCLYFLLVASVPGCEEQVEGYVYVDNGSPNSIVVYVDSKREAEIGPGRCRRLTLPLGQRHFRVEPVGGNSGPEWVYEKAHLLDSGDRPFRRPAYILNPDGLNRYCDVRVVEDDDDDVDGGRDLEGQLSLVSRKTKANPPSGSLSKREEMLGLTREYEELTRRMVPMGESEFFQVDDLSIVFQLVTPVHHHRQQKDVARRTLTRVPRVLHDYLVEASQISDPTVDELDRLKVAEDLALAYVPFRP